MRQHLLSPDIPHNAENAALERLNECVGLLASTEELAMTNCWSETAWRWFLTNPGRLLGDIEQALTDDWAVIQPLHAVGGHINRPNHPCIPPGRMF
jgi:hypothetical protein